MSLIFIEVINVDNEFPSNDVVMTMDCTADTLLTHDMQEVLRYTYDALMMNNHTQPATSSNKGIAWHVIVYALVQIVDFFQRVH
jgi:hypothetical protein